MVVVLVVFWDTGFPPLGITTLPKRTAVPGIEDRMSLDAGQKP